MRTSSRKFLTCVPSLLTFCQKLPWPPPLSTWRIGYISRAAFVYLHAHPACTHTSHAYAHPRLGDGPTWRMSSRAIKGPVGKRLTTICPEHVSERPPSNKGPLRLSSPPLPLFLFAREPVDPSSPRTTVVVGEATVQAASCTVEWSIHLSLSLTLPLILSFPLRSQEWLAFPARHATPESSCFLSATSLPLPLLFFPFRRPTHYRTLFVDWLSPVIPFVRGTAIFNGPLCSREGSPFIAPPWYISRLRVISR